MKDYFFTNIEHFRYERKFYIEGLDAEKVEVILKSHPAIFREIYHKRRVNNIYFDSFGLQHYFDNVNGVDRRLKVRIRWYGDLFGFIKKPMLELKLKHNLHVGKLLYPLEAFTLDSSFSIDVIREIFRKSQLNEGLKLHLAELNFSLLNSYDRKYFLSSSGDYRVTIDDNMRAYELSLYQNNFLYSRPDRTGTILELKYNKPHDELVSGITNYFPFRITRSSKYIDGVRSLSG